jgi:hypothetical protein
MHAYRQKRASSSLLWTSALAGVESCSGVRPRRPHRRGDRDYERDGDGPLGSFQLDEPAEAELRRRASLVD